MRETPIILPVFTTSVPLDFPSEGTFAFNKKTHKQLEVTVRINEHQYFNMNFLNHDGYIMACCRWAHVLDFAENGYDRYEQIIKKYCCPVNFKTAQESFPKPFRIGLRAFFFKKQAP